jgi:transcriptional regulator with XRE-family HTH domain
MDPKTILGKFIRLERLKRKQSQQSFAEKVGITYQYLSEVENGKANLTVDVLDAIARALGLDFARLVSQAFLAGGRNEIPCAHPDFFRRNVPLPGSLTFGQIEAALNETQRMVAVINSNLGNLGTGALHTLIQGNNFSGLVSNLLTESFNRLSHFKSNSHQRYPDLIDRKSGEGLEIKTTIRVGKGGESHNGNSGWHLVACYETMDDGNIGFVHVMLACLLGIRETAPDWKYLGSKVSESTGSQRTETYITTGAGLTKLRDGSVYLNPARVDCSRWRVSRAVGEKCPEWSIFSKTR